MKKRYYPFIILFAVLAGVFCNNEKTPPASGFIKAGNFNIYYERAGRGEAILLLHAGINGYDKIHPIDSVSMDWWNQFSKALNAHDTAGAAKEFTKALAEGIYCRGDSLKAPVSLYVYNTTLENLHTHKMEGWPNLQSNPPGIENLGQRCFNGLKAKSDQC